MTRKVFQDFEAWMRYLAKPAINTVGRNDLLGEEIPFDAPFIIGKYDGQKEWYSVDRQKFIAWYAEQNTGEDLTAVLLSLEET